MKSVVELEIRMPQKKLAALYADPANNTKWMRDVDRCEPVSGRSGTTGSKYRLVPKKGDREFVVTVIARNLPDELRLHLDASHLTVAVKATFAALSAKKTRLISEEVFRFKSRLGRLFGFLARGPMRKAHRRHMAAFKRFAEHHA